jgi:hypothetical protein
MTSPISTTLCVGEYGTEILNTHILNELKTCDGDRCDRLRAVHEILRDLTWVDGYKLDLRRWSETKLWDLWGLIPPSLIEVRKNLARYLERSPLIKLAECAE